MGNTIAETYTDELYLSKNELKTALHTSLIEGPWNEIAGYRKRFSVRLEMQTIKGHPMGAILTQAIRAKLNLVEVDFRRLINKMRTIAGDELADGDRLLRFAEMHDVAALEGKMNDPAIKAYLSSRYRPAGEEGHDRVINFGKTLAHFLAHAPIPADDQFLGTAYGLLLNTDALLSFYRESDPDGAAKRAALTNSDYPYCPFEKIPVLMDGLYAMIKNVGVPAILKAIVAFFYITALAPFESRNEELAILMAQDILAADDYGSEAFYLPFSALLVPSEKRENAILNTKRTGDVTYFLYYAISVLRARCNELMDELVRQGAEVYRKEAYLVDEGLEEPSDRGISSSERFDQMSLLDEAETPKPVRPAAPRPAPVPKAVERPTPAPKRVEPEPKPAGQEISLGRAPKALSDREVKEYTQYLLESNPNLNKNQASFLASHCVIGHYYTIQQFKKHARCAYETARTSMDKLAAEGYYRKEQVKNKYVYTPIAADKR